MKEQNPLISIIVVSYNSSKYVLETLESAKAQTYQNIELIISDDCSTDNTVEICREWIDKNKERFVRTELITVPENTGIPANCNRGVRAAQGEWVKLIAGDDALMEAGIEDYVAFINKTKEAQIICANVIKFNSEKEEKTEIQNWKFFKKDISANEQYKFLLRSNRVLASGVFIKKELILQVGCFDEYFPLIEDYPMWLKITKMGIKIYPFNNATIKYRLSENGISCMQNALNKNLIPNIFRLSKRVRLKYCLNYLPLIEKVDLLYSYCVESVFIKTCNKNTKLTLFLLTSSKIFNPFVLYRKFLSLIHIKYRYIDYIIE